MAVGEISVDAWAKVLTAAAATIAQRESAHVIDTADKIAATQRDLVPKDRPELVDTIAATRVNSGDDLRQGDLEADIGPSMAHGDQYFVANFIEGGTATLPPRPFVAPSAVKHADEFAGKVALEGAVFDRLRRIRAL